MFQNLLHHRVAFRVHTGHVQGVVAAPDAQKTGALLEGFRPQTRHAEQLLPVGKRAVAVAPTHHRLRHVFGQARHLAQQRHTGGVQVHPHRVHAVLHHRVQAAAEFKRVDVVLVLAHANRFRINFHQLGQGVLQAPRNAGGTAQRHIHIGHFLAGQFTRAVNRRTGFADHHFLHGQGLRQLGQTGHEFSGEFVGFAAGRAVANRDQVHAMRHAQLRQGMQ